MVINIYYSIVYTIYNIIYILYIYIYNDILNNIVHTIHYNWNGGIMLNNLKYKFRVCFPIRPVATGARPPLISGRPLKLVSH